MSTDSPKTCPLSTCNFSFCFWAKLIVAIPALPITAIFVAALFENQVLGLVAGVVTASILVWAAVKLDRNPRFKGMILPQIWKK